MRKLKTILVDDEPRGLSSLKKLLSINCPNVDVLACCEDSRDAEAKIMALHPELVFLDIMMPEKNGFELLRTLPKIDFKIIFITAHVNFMTQAFQFSAIDYLLKPVDDELLKDAVNRAVDSLDNTSGKDQIETLLHNMGRQRSQNMKLCIPFLKGYKVVDVEQIIYCEASMSYTRFFFTDHEPILASKSIYQYETLLEDCNFVRIHKSFMINMEHVKEYRRGEGGNVTLSNGKVLEVSRRKKEAFISRMKEAFKF